MNQFQPRYVKESDLTYYGLPNTSQQPNIMSMIDAASTFVDQHCGRTDGNGNGTLVMSTYAERLLMQSPGRNIAQVSFKPITVISGSLQTQLQASGSVAAVNCYDTGFLPNTILRSNGSVSAIIAASGRYSYTRRGQQALYPDLNYGMNLMQVASWFGGPPGWTPIDVSNIDYDPSTGEIWVPAGLYQSAYTEVAIVYNTGHNPLAMPKAICHATAMLVRNFLAQPATNLRSVGAPGAMSFTFTDTMIDKNIEEMLRGYVNVLAY